MRSEEIESILKRLENGEISEDDSTDNDDDIAFYSSQRDRLMELEDEEDVVARCAEKGRQDLVKATCDIVATEIENIWKRASLPIVKHKTIVSKITSYHEKHRAFLKSYQKSKDNENYKQKLQKFKGDCDVLFDIGSCKCKSLSTRTCEKTRKISKREHEYLLDQRGERRMMIGSLDKKAALKNIALSDRKLKRKQFEENSMTLQVDEPEQKRRKTKTSSIINLTSIFPAINIPGPSKFPVVAMTLDRYGISDRAGAAIVSATLQDIGLVTEARSRTNEKFGSCS
ncbi:unnamed protein product [Parnassius apollo]|uniref:(apollo) hypothetical protein n=1 Tax=Parnassius apollo TaxID=110799 RepID=A0A8S3X420_PARAO|nr:unnamed protein product [Parnassius apollo]